MHIEKLGELFNKWFQPIQATLRRVFVPLNVLEKGYFRIPSWLTAKMIGHLGTWGGHSLFYGNSGKWYLGTGKVY